MKLMRRWVISCFVSLAFALVASTAFGFGTIRVKNDKPEETEGSWKLAFDIDYGSTPHIGHIQMILSFKHTVQWEWSITDQSPNKPVLNKKPLQNQPENSVDVDVGFADMRGDLFRKTTFDIKLRRDSDFEAGEYELTVRRASDRAILGRPMRLTLQGKNEPIDRRSISFHADDPVKKVPPTTTAKPSGDPADEAAGSKSASDPEPGYVEDLVADDPASAPPPVEPKQGGCGCRLGASRESTREPTGERALASIALALVGLVGLRRKVQRR